MWFRSATPGRSHRRSRSAQARPRQPKASLNPDRPREKRIEIDLLDLDAIISNRQGVKVSVRPTSRLPQIAAFLKRQFCTGSKQIHRDANIQIYLNENQIKGDEIPADASTLRYRVLDPGDDGAIRVHWTGRHLTLTPTQLTGLQQAIQAGKSIGDLRASVTQCLRESNPSYAHLMKDPNQVEIRAIGGLRPGPLQSNQWKAQNTSTWLSRHLTLAIRPPRDFYILKGFNEEYVWHCPAIDRYEHVSVRGLKRWLERKILTTVNHRGDRWEKVEARDISLLHRGRPLRDKDRVLVGSVMEFRLPRAIGEDFVKEEAWLLPLTFTCSVCLEDKRVSELPQQITPSCDHQVTTCKDCVAQWIASSLESVTWDRVKCPECRVFLSFEDVQSWADPETITRYDELATKAVLGSIDEFQWCLNPHCKSGQMYPAGCSKAKCHECRHYSCVQHNVPWHSGETCEHYDQRTRKQRRGEEASTIKIKETTKPCPSCKRAVDKYTGCDHITCICGHEWCYLCLKPYTLDADYLLQCSHRQTCRYFGNPPEYEGARPLFQFLDLEEPLEVRHVHGVPLAPRPPQAAVRVGLGEIANAAIIQAR